MSIPSTGKYVGADFKPNINTYPLKFAAATNSNHVDTTALNNQLSSIPGRTPVATTTTQSSTPYLFGTPTKPGAAFLGDLQSAKAISQPLNPHNPTLQVKPIVRMEPIAPPQAKPPPVQSGSAFTKGYTTTANGKTYDNEYLDQLQRGNSQLTHTTQSRQQIANALSENHHRSPTERFLDDLGTHFAQPLGVATQKYIEPAVAEAFLDTVPVLLGPVGAGAFAGEEAAGAGIGDYEFGAYGDEFH